VAEILEYLDDNFDIPDDGVNSDIEGLDEDDFDKENDMLPEVAASDDKDDEDVNLTALDIEENDDRGRGRPSNVSLHDFEWSSERSEVEILSFSQAVGPTNVMPRESSAVDFFQLFVDNRILGKIVAETNRYAYQSLQARNKDIGSWKDIS